jgi:hypothetical protein
MSAIRPKLTYQRRHAISVVEGRTDLAKTWLMKTQTAARSSLSAPRITIFNAPSGNGRCGTLTSSHGARIQKSRSCSVVRMTGNGPRMDRLDARIRRRGQEAIDQMRARARVPHRRTEALRPHRRARISHRQRGAAAPLTFLQDAEDRTAIG